MAIYRRYSALRAFMIAILMWQPAGTYAGDRVQILKAKVFGVDDRLDPRSKLGPDTLKIANNVGRVECPIPGSKYLHATTGWLVASNRTIITLSHSFKIEADAETGRSAVTLNPDTCVFARYDEAGNLLEPRIPFERTIIWWRKYPSHDDEPAFDFAAALLKTPSTQPFKSPRITDIPPSPNGTGSLIIAFSNDLVDHRIARAVYGTAYPMTGAERQRPGIKFTASRLFVFDMDTGSGSSGGMVFNSATGEVFGLCLGWVSVTGKTENEEKQFDRMRRFNYGLLFNREMANDLLSLIPK